MSDQAITAEEVVEGGEQEVAPAAPRSRKKLLLLVGAPVLALLLIGGGLYFSGILNRFIGSKTVAQEKPAPHPAVFFDLPDLLVNLNSTGRKSNFLKMSVSLELENQVDIARLQAVMPRIIDAFQVYLRELRIEDLKGSAGLYRLREELLRRVNVAVAPVKVVDVLFKEMLVQ